MRAKRASFTVVEDIYFAVKQKLRWNARFFNAVNKMPRIAEMSSPLCWVLSLSPCHLELVKERRAGPSSLIRHLDLKKYFYFRPPPRLLQLNFSCLTWIAFIPVDTGGPSISREAYPGEKIRRSATGGRKVWRPKKLRILPHSYKLCTCLWPHFTCSPPWVVPKTRRTTKDCISWYV